MRRAWLLSLLALAALAASGCGDRRPISVGDLGGSPWRDGDPSARDHSLTPAPDQALRRDLRPIVDQGLPAPDWGMCPPCKAGEVYLLKSGCFPTDQITDGLFMCVPSCDPKSPSACGAGKTCDQWGATPCCVCAAAVPACVPKPSTGPLTGPLRISPTSGTAGQPVKLIVSGSPFYIGALFYKVRLGTEEKMEESGAGECTIGATFTPKTPGLYAVEVSQYGGGGPWVLAGFYLASGGAIGDPEIQPGYTCPTATAKQCASAGPYACGCTNGRCVCKKK